MGRIDLFFKDEYEHHLIVRVHRIGGQLGEIDHYIEMKRNTENELVGEKHPHAPAYLMKKYRVKNGESVYEGILTYGSRDYCFHWVLSYISASTKISFPITKEGIVYDPNQGRKETHPQST